MKTKLSLDRALPLAAKIKGEERRQKLGASNGHRLDDWQRIVSGYPTCLYRMVREANAIFNLLVKRPNLGGNQAA